jgi:nitrogen fixation-related uncharacterized protein
VRGEARSGAFGRRVRRRLGLPTLRGRAAIMIVLLVICLVLGSIALATFLINAGKYRDDRYDPKDFERTEPARQLEGRP